MNIFQEYIKLGLSCIPCEGKRPKVNWKPYQEKIATLEEAKSWAGNVAIICGKVSGGTVCIDFDTKNGNKYDQWLLLINREYPEILSNLVIEKTPSGGYHVIFNTDVPISNLKLAMNKNNEATIETRGEGGYFVCAPSMGYSWEYNTINDIRTLSTEETKILIMTAKSLNEYITETVSDYKTDSGNQIEGTTPFDDYNSKCNPLDILQAHGWDVLFRRGETYYLKRPNKKERCISATWNAIPDRFYCFSTSTQFENNHIYKASAVYAILEHNGDYNSAARELFAKGYGRIDKINTNIRMVETSEIEKKVKKVYDEGYLKGKSTGWKSLDELYSVIKGQFTVVTGYPSHGKSEFVDALTMNMAINEDWKFAYFSPENYPVEMHYHKLIEKYSREPFTGINKMSYSKVQEAIKYIKWHYYFIDALEEEITLDSILTTAQKLIDTKKIDGLVIDPWNEIELSKPQGMSTTEYIGASLRKSRKFARRNNIHLWIVAHPIKPTKDKNGKYPIPDLYSIEGSSHWRNKADNGICVYRDKDADGNDFTEVNIQKIKYRYTGKPGTCRLIYNPSNGTYFESNVMEW